MENFKFKSGDLVHPVEISGTLFGIILKVYWVHSTSGPVSKYNLIVVKTNNPTTFCLGRTFLNIPEAWLSKVETQKKSHRLTKIFK